MTNRNGFDTIAAQLHSYRRVSMGSAEPKFPYQKVVVTGGAGFWADSNPNKLKAYPGIEVVVPRSVDYDLVRSKR